MMLDSDLINEIENCEPNFRFRPKKSTFRFYAETESSDYIKKPTRSFIILLIQAEKI